MAGGRGRGRGRGGGGPAPDALPSAGPSAGLSTAATEGAGLAGGRRACEVCEAAPGIPFCRVEWSFLCSSCGPALHRDSWIVAVPPFPPGPTPPTTSADASSQVSPYFFPPFMQMPPNPMQLPMPMPVHPPNTNAGTAGVKRKRRRTRFTSASKEQTPGAAAPAAGTDTDPDPNPNPDPDRLKRKSRQPPPPAPTRADAGNVYADLHPGVQGTTVANAPQSAEDGAQLDTMESIAAGMEPPPPELDELEQGIEAQREQ